MGNQSSPCLFNFRFFQNRCYLILLLLGFVIHSFVHATVNETHSASGVCVDDQCVSSCDVHQQNQNGSPSEALKPSQDVLECGLYMAPSSIPNAGWGMYTGIPLTKGSIIHPMDVSLQLLDYGYHQRISRNQQHRYPAIYNQATIPERWLITQYDWVPSMTYAIFEASSVSSIIPGLGMLANSHTGLVNVANQGPTLRRPLAERNHPSAGSFSHFQNMTFSAMYDLPAGHELFVEYGDKWFSDRSEKFGEELPLSNDFHRADGILDTFSRLLDDRLNSSYADDLYQLVRHHVLPGYKSRPLSALPKTLEAAVNVLSMDRGGLSKSAYGSVVDVIRDSVWLQQNGLCLDHIRPGMSLVRPEQHGAFAARFLPDGTVVAPAPLIHLHRSHLDMYVNDPYDDNDIFWRGQQLFLNYVYGHPSTSVVLFPYAPVVNLINHGGKERANVRVRWSSAMSKPEWLNLTTNELLPITDKAGLMMEFVALRDIDEGDEILVDYGDDWQQAWDKHVEDWKPPLNSDRYISAWKLNEEEKHIKVSPTPNDWHYPTSVFTLCWVNNALKPTADDPEWYIWDETVADDLTHAKPCVAVKQQHDENGQDLYHVILSDAPGWDFPQVKRVPRHAISFAEQRYAGHQALRQSFRHEIILPDDMIPENWKDVESSQSQDSACGLYMAESSISNAGLGLYTANTLQDNQAIFYGEAVIQVEDARDNSELRRRYNREHNKEPGWLLEDYFWQPQTTYGTSEAGRVESIVPGFGMMANSHTGLVNAEIRPPQIIANDFHRFKDPGAGASTYYHSLHFAANQDIGAGTEIFVPYGDNWFKERRESLGTIPLSYDYVKADLILNRFVEVVGNDWKSDRAKDLWRLINQMLSIGKGDRVRIALPKEMSEIKPALDIGTARFSLPEQRRTLDWLTSNGRCLDNIKPGKSSIPQAGRGAFATRFIESGALVTTTPVVHFQRKYLEVFNSNDMSNPKAESWFEGMQLLLNYGYGHPQSSLVLFPYSPVVNYINHGGNDHNARLEWSNIALNHRDWLNRSPDDLVANETHAGLILEVVATRDITPGEEILLDYGEDWSIAWNYHVENWKPRGRDSSYLPASAFNDVMKPVRTLDEHNENPYPGNVYTACWVQAYDKPEESPLGLMFSWKYSKGLYYRSDRAIWCDVLERVEVYTDLRESVNFQQDLYVVRVHQSEDNKLLLQNVPRRAIQFFDEKYTSDLSFRRAFRHSIGLPDSLVPESWRDIGDEESPVSW